MKKILLYLLLGITMAGCEKETALAPETTSKTIVFEIAPKEDYSNSPLEVEIELIIRERAPYGDVTAESAIISRQPAKTFLSTRKTLQIATNQTTSSLSAIYIVKYYFQNNELIMNEQGSASIPRYGSTTTVPVRF